MNIRKGETTMSGLCIQFADHSRSMCSVLSSLMEHRSLVDLKIRCGNKMVHVHKCILAASSGYFREQLEKNPGTEQVIINGLDFTCMKSIIEFIYCGNAIIENENMKYVVAAANFFQIQGLRALPVDMNNATGRGLLCIPPPVFINKELKNSSVNVPVTLNSQSIPIIQPISQDNRTNLGKISTKRQAGKCNKKFQGNELIGEREGLPMQVVNFDDPSTPMMTESLPDAITFVIANAGKKTVDQIKNVFGKEMHPLVEVVYQTLEGEYIEITDEVLQKIPDNMLQFEMVAENGRKSEAKANDKKSSRKFNTQISPSSDNSGASTSMDSDSIICNSQELNAEEAANENVEKTSDVALQQTYDHENNNIMHEVSSIQFYDNCIFEDVAQNVEVAFQRL